MARKRLGKLAPRYRFALNPFVDVRWSFCPSCREPTHERKFPLFIHVDGWGPVVLGKTCRYCTSCEFIVVHQHELEAQLADLFAERKPEAIGNDYFVIATVERKIWQRSLHETVSFEEMLLHTSDIRRYHQLLDPKPRWVYTGPEERR